MPDLFDVAGAEPDPSPAEVTATGHLGGTRRSRPPQGPEGQPRGSRPICTLGRLM